MEKMITKPYLEKKFSNNGELGFTGMTIPEAYGGAELQYTDFCVFLEELSKTSVPYAAVSVSSMVQSILNKFGNEDQKKTYLPELTSGKEIGAFALSESGSGSDASSLKTTAQEVDDLSPKWVKALDYFWWSRKNLYCYGENGRFWIKGSIRLYR